MENPALVKEACSKYRDAVIAGIDARDGIVATRGWVKESGQRALDLALAMEEAGVMRFIYTDISRDGTLTEPNFTATAELVEKLELPVIAAGGVSSITHLKMLEKLGVEGAIIGKALYTGDINLKEALSEIHKL